MLGIVIPAHNEEREIGACVRAACQAARHPALRGETVEVLVVLDSCTDATAVRAAQAGALTLSLRAHHVGAARAMGAEALLAHGARWLAFTDARTLVSPDWLADQLALEAEAVCDGSAVNDGADPGAPCDLLRAQALEICIEVGVGVDGRQRPHGANLGISAAAYRQAGGFRHLACSEDAAFVHALQAAGVRIAWRATPRLLTGAGHDCEATAGPGAPGMINPASDAARSAQASTASHSPG